MRHGIVTAGTSVRPVQEPNSHLPDVQRQIVKSFEYLTELQRHAQELAANPAE